MNPTVVARTLFAVAVAAMLLVPTYASAQCSVCEPCGSDADCGAGGSCLDLGDGSGPFCTVLGCTASSCPGDSVCYEVSFSDGTVLDMCLNADASSSLCPASYTCADDGQACSGLGYDCASGPDACLAVGSSLCLTVSDSSGASDSFCTCFCQSDADCGDGNVCVELTSGDFACAPASVMSSSNGGGGTATDLCEGVTCPAGAICSPATGTCIGGALPPADAGEADAGSSNATADAGATTATEDTWGGSTSSAAQPGADAGPGADPQLTYNPSGGKNDNASTVTIPGGTSNFDNDPACACKTMTRPDPPAPWAIFGLSLVGAIVLLRRRRSH